MNTVCLRGPLTVLKASVAALERLINVAFQSAAVPFYVDKSKITPIF